jgi:hypothetical protein
VFDGILDELRGGVQTECLHQTVPVEFDGSPRYMQEVRDFLGTPSFGGKLQYFTLPLRQAV